MRFAPAIPLLLLSAPAFAQLVTGSVSGYGSMASQTNSPISMVFEHKQSQTLTDGTHINLVSHEYFYRDNLGRVRTETEFATPRFGESQSVRSVSVRDPVARTFTSWQIGGQDGMVHQFTRIDQTPPQRPQRAAATNPSQPRIVAPKPVPQLSTRPKTTTEQLGTQDVQGVTCEASRMTVVYPANFMGNDQPITTVAQRCLSREFGRELIEYDEDPRTGTRSTMLQSVSRGEPDPSLFQPPPDYSDAKSGTR